MGIQELTKGQFDMITLNQYDSVTKSASTITYIREEYTIKFNLDSIEGAGRYQFITEDKK